MEECSPGITKPLQESTSTVHNGQINLRCPSRMGHTLTVYIVYSHSNQYSELSSMELDLNTFSVDQLHAAQVIIAHYAEYLRSKLLNR